MRKAILMACSCMPSCKPLIYLLASQFDVLPAVAVQQYHQSLLLMTVRNISISELGCPSTISRSKPCSSMRKAILIAVHANLLIYLPASQFDVLPAVPFSNSH